MVMRVKRMIVMTVRREGVVTAVGVIPSTRQRRRGEVQIQGRESASRGSGGEGPVLMVLRKVPVVM